MVFLNEATDSPRINEVIVFVQLQILGHSMRYIRYKKTISWLGYTMPFHARAVPYSSGQKS